MKIGEHIYKLRKEKGFSQEELAEEINVSRQTISNWELGETLPNPEQVKLLANVFEVSCDFLLDNVKDVDMHSTTRYGGYEYISKTKIRGVPLVHINLSGYHEIRKAKGIIAIGNIAKGVVALGGVSMGIFSLGGVSLGLFSFGGAALGLLLALGGLALGSVSFGGVAIGLFACGGLAIGLYSLGGFAIAKYIAAGDYAYGYLAIGNHVKGTVELLQSELTTSMIESQIVKYFPKTWDIIVFIFSNVHF